MHIYKSDIPNAENLIREFLENNKQIYVLVASDNFNDDTLTLEHYYNPIERDFISADNIYMRHHSNDRPFAFATVCNNLDLVKSYTYEDFSKPEFRHNFAEYLTFLNTLKKYPQLELSTSKGTLAQIILQKKNS